EGIGAFLISRSFIFQSNQVVALAAHYGLPAMYADRRIVEAGGLASYAADSFVPHRLAGNYVGRILKGENPADLPVQQSERTDHHPQARQGPRPHHPGNAVGDR